MFFHGNFMQLLLCILQFNHVIFLNFFFLDATKPPAAVTIFFGANDAAVLGRANERQHVPIEEYKENLRKMVHHLKVQSLSL